MSIPPGLLQTIGIPWGVYMTLFLQKENQVCVTEHAQSLSDFIDFEQKAMTRFIRGNHWRNVSFPPFPKALKLVCFLIKGGRIENFPFILLTDIIYVSIFPHFEQCCCCFFSFVSAPLCMCCAKVLLHSPAPLCVCSFDKNGMFLCIFNRSLMQYGRMK